MGSIIPLLLLIMRWREYMNGLLNGKKMKRLLTNFSKVVFRRFFFYTTVEGSRIRQELFIGQCKGCKFHSKELVIQNELISDLYPYDTGVFCTKGLFAKNGSEWIKSTLIFVDTDYFIESGLPLWIAIGTLLDWQKKKMEGRIKGSKD